MISALHLAAGDQGPVGGDPRQGQRGSLAGFPLGLAIGNPMKGILTGTGIGIGLALLTWLIDMLRRL